MGLPMLTQVYHKMFSLLLSIWDKGCQPNGIYDTLLEGPTNAKERKGEGSLHGRKEEAQERSRRYRLKMTEAYGKTIKERIFTEGQLVQRTTDHVKRGLAGPSKFSPKWKGAFVVREANASGCYHLA